MKKVLIIDDDRWFSETISKSLRKHGWKVRLEPDGKKGMQAIDDFKPDAVLLDFLLPGISAPALLNELQSHNDLADLPVVLCTSLSSVNFEPSSLESYGVRSVLDKAEVKPQEILEELESAIAQN